MIDEEAPFPIPAKAPSGPGRCPQIVIVADAGEDDLLALGRCRGVVAPIAAMGLDPFRPWPRCGCRR